MTIHFVYPHNQRMIAAPWSIGNHVAQGLRCLGHEVQQYDWESPCTITPQDGDVLLGHPHPTEGFVFRNSLVGDWKRRIALAPFNGSKDNISFGNKWIGSVDTFLAICGPYWRNYIPWENVIPIDMAVNRLQFPRATSFADPGRRSIAYIGCTVPDKGTDYLAEVSNFVNAKIYHFGPGIVGGQVVECGLSNFQRGPPAMDFVIATGRNDANPTSILEGVHWGMLAFCTPQSGWGGDVAQHLPLDNARMAADILNWWLAAPTKMLERCRASVDDVLPNYAWDRFVDKVNNATK